jgi:hypothetical protein
LRMGTLTLPLSDRLTLRVTLYMMLKPVIVLSLYAMVDTLVLYPHAFGIGATADLDDSETLA